MNALPALAFCLLLQTPSPTVKPEKPIVKNGTGADRKEAAKNKGKTDLPPSQSQNIGVPSAPEGSAKENQKQEESSGRVYKVDIVTPSAPPQETPLYVRYVWITGIGVFFNLLIWIAILTQNKINRRSADALVKSQCAWVMVDISNSARVTIQHTHDGVTARISCSFRNEGQTPAWLTELRCGSAIFADDAIPPTQNFDLLPIREEFLAEPLGGKEQSKEPIDFCVQCPARPGTLIIYGRVKYRDMFGSKDRSTTFGYWAAKGPSPVRVTRINHPTYNNNT